MLTQSSSNNVQSLKEFDFAQAPHHQEIIFRDSKFIFYDSHNCFPKISRTRANKRYTNLNTNHNKKISFTLLRPQTVDYKQISSFARRQTKNSQNLSHRKQNSIVNVKLKAKNNSGIGKRAPSSQAHTSLTRNSKVYQNEHSTRSQIKRPNLVERLNTKGSDQITNLKRVSSAKKINLASSRAKLQNNHQKEGKKQQKDKNIEPKQIQKKEQQKNIEGEINSITHEEIKRFFGAHHGLMKPLSDYLSLNPCMTSDQNKIGSVIQKSNEEEKLQSELAKINSKITEMAASGKTNKSLLNKSEKKENVFIKERAQIVSYLRNSQTKELYNVLVNKQQKQLRYSDQQFNHKNYLSFDDSDVMWVYIEPNAQVKLFPPNFEQSMSKLQETEKWRSWQSDKFDLPFVSLLRCIFSKQPNIIKRLFQPAINNVYSIWLFLNGVFEPVYVDGYFPLDEKLNHFYGGSGEYLWLPILIKCVCKVFNTYSRKVLMKIKNNQIYRLLTGLDLVPLHSYCQPTGNNTLKEVVIKEIQQGSTILSYNLQKKITYIVHFTGQNELILVNSNLLSIQNLGNFQKSQNSTIFVIPPFSNCFIYTFSVYRQSLSKFELSCQRSIEVVFSVASFSFSSRDSEISKIKNIYIYEVQSYGKSNLKTKLILREEASLKSTHKSKLKRGRYKIFVEDGQKKIHLLFDGNSLIKWNEGATGEKYRLSILSSHQIKISQMESLERKEGRVEDSSNIYHNYDKK